MYHVRAMQTEWYLNLVGTPTAHERCARIEDACNETDLRIQLNLAPEWRIASLLHVSHQPRRLRLEAPGILIHILEAP